MGKRGFSLTTVVLVAVLIGALYMVGKTVNPPPPGPPEQPPAAKVTDKRALPGKPGPGGPMDPAKRAEMMKKMALEDQKRRMSHMPPHGKPGSAPTAKKFDPNSIEITNDWTNHMKPGAVGEQEMQQKVAEAKAQQVRERALNPPAPVVPSSASPGPRGLAQPQPAPGAAQNKASMK
jgi:hypothetical protein